MVKMSTKQAIHKIRNGNKRRKEGFQEMLMGICEAFCVKADQEETQLCNFISSSGGDFNDFIALIQGETIALNPPLPSKKTVLSLPDGFDKTTKPRKASKSGKYKIFLDANGKEVERKPLGPGKPLKGSTKGPDGNWYCQFVEKVATTIKNADYITLDTDGNVLHREPRKRGRGRPEKGFKKQIDGEYAGHFVKTI